MEIIRCTIQDLEEYEIVARQSFIDAFEKVSEPNSFKKYVSTSFLPEVLRIDLEDDKMAVFFLKNDAGETTGYVKLRWDRSDDFFQDTPALELQRIYLLEEHWNKGYGTVFLDFCEQYGRDHNFEWIWLVVWSENHGAIRFYERQGWEKFAIKDFQFGDEVHHDPVLKKKLAL